MVSKNFKQDNKSFLKKTYQFINFLYPFIIIFLVFSNLILSGTQAYD